MILGGPGGIRSYEYSAVGGVGWIESGCQETRGGSNLSEPAAMGNPPGKALRPCPRPVILSFTATGSPTYAKHACTQYAFFWWRFIVLSQQLVSCQLSGAAMVRRGQVCGSCNFETLNLFTVDSISECVNIIYAGRYLHGAAVPGTVPGTQNKRWPERDSSNAARHRCPLLYWPGVGEAKALLAGPQHKLVQQLAPGLALWQALDSFYL